MPRHFIGLIVAITAFSTGILCAGLWNSTEKSPIKSQPAIARPALTRQENARTTFAPEAVYKPVPDNVKFTCKNRLSSFLLNHIRRNNPEMDIDGFIKVLKIENCAELFTIEQRVDLNSDGQEEYVVRSNHGCGATGNCQTLIVQGKRQGYRVILDATLEEILVRKTKTAGYRNIVSTFDLGAIHRTLTTFSFSDGKYRIIGCSDEHTTIDGKRSLKPLKLSACR